jgi:hypothetical protein
MTRRLISATLLSATPILSWASAALAHGGTEEGRLFSWDNTFLAQVTAGVVGVVCYAVMVWDPQGRNGERSRNRRAE